MTDIAKTPGPILSLRGSFGNALRHVNRLIQRDLNMRIGGLDISLGQWYALRTLWASDGLTQIELAQKSGVAGAAMVLAVRSLLAAGLVSRRRDAEDRRKYVITLTSKGRALERPALEAAVGANEEALAGIPAADVEVCMRVLWRAHDNLLAAGLPGESEEVDALLG